ncbi:hypothetical protein HYC85_013123 [Camellia sinensis]|uniref:Dirigent protein n=1 Tax=Camellia sinensis TaxID=4442 RepID=A0A7J7H5X5_CAMSI|nr:hypothetical protein HYC85_013123 [Camellia sinensis]
MAVAQANSTATSPTFFGLTYPMKDDPLTGGPSQSSKGKFGLTFKEQVSQFMAMNLVFTEEKYYNGNALAVLGINPTLQPKRELTIVGGTSVFKMARGVALL